MHPWKIQVKKKFFDTVFWSTILITLKNVLSNSLTLTHSVSLWDTQFVIKLSLWDVYPFTHSLLISMFFHHIKGRMDRQIIGLRRLPFCEKLNNSMVQFLASLCVETCFFSCLSLSLSTLTEEKKSLSKMDCNQEIHICISLWKGTLKRVLDCNQCKSLSWKWKLHNYQSGQCSGNGLNQYNQLAITCDYKSHLVCFTQSSPSIALIAVFFLLVCMCTCVFMLPYYQT